MNKTTLLRIVLITIGLQTIVAGLMGLYGGVTQLRAWQGDPLSAASLVALMLGVLLGIGGIWLIRRGMKYQSPPA